MNDAVVKEPQQTEKEKASHRVAMLALFGTILTVCGTLTGALIGGATTIYKAARSAERLELFDPQGVQSLQVDTGKLRLTASSVADLDPDQYQIFPEQAFAMPRPLPGWDDRGALTYADLFGEENTNLSPLIFYYETVGFDWDLQTVRQLRHEEPLIITYVAGSSENGIAVDADSLASPAITFHSQMTVLVLERPLALESFSLPGLALYWGALHYGGLNAIIANENSPYIFEQVSWRLEDVEVNGARRDLTLERWGLFIEGDDHIYIVEIQYVPRQSARVWDELQQYFLAFRIID